MTNATRQESPTKGVGSLFSEEMRVGRMSGQRSSFWQGVKRKDSRPLFCDALLSAGYVHVVDVDFKSYFDTIPHERLMQRVRTKIADGRVLRLIESFLTQSVLQGMQTCTPTAGSR